AGCECEVSAAKLCCCVHIGRESDHLVTLVAALFGACVATFVRPLTAVVALEFGFEPDAPVEASTCAEHVSASAPAAAFECDDRDRDRILELAVCAPRRETQIEGVALLPICDAALNLPGGFAGALTDVVRPGHGRIRAQRVPRQRAGVQRTWQVGGVQ